MPNFSQEIRQYLPYLFGIAHNILGNVEDAEDAVQESICKFLVHRDKIQEKEKWKMYLGRIVVNHSLDQVRKRKKMVSLEGDVESRTPSSSKGDLSQQVYFWLQKLSPKDRLVIDLFYREDHSLKEISQLLGDSIGAVKIRLHRARKTLKKFAEKDPP